MPSWVSDETVKLKEDSDAAKRVFLQSKARRRKVAWRKLNSSLNLSYKRDRTEALHRQMYELCTAEEKGDYSTTWEKPKSSFLNGKTTSAPCSTSSAPRQKNYLLLRDKTSPSSLIDHLLKKQRRLLSNRSQIRPLA